MANTCGPEIKMNMDIQETEKTPVCLKHIEFIISEFVFRQAEYLLVPILQNVTTSPEIIWN